MLVGWGKPSSLCLLGKGLAEAFDSRAAAPTVRLVYSSVTRATSRVHLEVRYDDYQQPEQLRSTQERSRRIVGGHGVRRSCNLCHRTAKSADTPRADWPSHAATDSAGSNVGRDPGYFFLYRLVIAGEPPLNSYYLLSCECQKAH